MFSWRFGDVEMILQAHTHLKVHRYGHGHLTRPLQQEFKARLVSSNAKNPCKTHAKTHAIKVNRQLVKDTQHEKRSESESERVRVQGLPFEA